MDEKISVKEIMTTAVITVQADDRLTKVVELLQDNPIHHLVVIKKGKVVGVISKKDLVRMHALVGQPEIGSGNFATTAEHIMSENPLTVDPDDSIGLVADIILANQFHSLPVVDQDELVGIVTSHDLIKYSYK